MPSQYEEMTKRIVRSYGNIPEPGHPNSTQEEVWDAYLVFFLFAYHLKDWLVCDEGLDITHEEINSFIEGNSNMKILQAIATQAKHLRAVHGNIRYDVHLYWNDESLEGSPAIQFEERDFLLAEDGGSLLTEDGDRIRLEGSTKEIHPRRLAIKILLAWNKFFKEKSIRGGFVIE